MYECNTLKYVDKVGHHMNYHFQIMITKNTYFINAAKLNRNRSG